MFITIGFSLFSVFLKYEIGKKMNIFAEKNIVW